MDQIEKEYFPYEWTYQKARHIKQILSGFCDRIEFAGSTRRATHQQHDLDLVAIEKWPTDLFGDLDRSTNSKLRIFLRERVKFEAEGLKLIRFKYGKLPVDLYTPPVDDFGVIMMIRTGSREFNLWVVNAIAAPLGIKFKDGSMIDNGQKVIMRHETDVFERLKLPWIPPSERHDQLWVPRWKESLENET